jgi:hypothetical protein
MHAEKSVDFKKDQIHETKAKKLYIKNTMSIIVSCTFI